MSRTPIRPCKFTEWRHEQVAGAALRGTSAGRYFGVALGGFIGMMLLIFIVQAILHPNAWCPSPMYIDNQGICQQP